MRIGILIIFIIILPLLSAGQSLQSLSSVCKQVSIKWKLDSNSCKGERLLLYPLLANSRPDSITKEFLFSTLGKPNRTQKYYIGYPERKNYVEYIYYIYMDDCPNIKGAGSSIGFVFDESETYFIRIEEHDYCG